MPLEDNQPSGSAELLPFPEEGYLFWPNNFSPDSRRLVGSLVTLENISDGAAILDIAAGTYQRISDKAVGRAIFLPDGERVLMSSPYGVEILDLETGALHTALLPSEGSTLVWADLSADGSQIAWNEQIDESDIWLASFEAKP